MPALCVQPEVEEHSFNPLLAVCKSKKKTSVWLRISFPCQPEKTGVFAICLEYYVLSQCSNPSQKHAF